VSASEAQAPPPVTQVREPYAGVIPCAGRSTRMGRPKSLLRVGGASFLERTVRALREGGCHPVVVVVATDDEDAAREASTAGAQVLLNPDPGEGPVTSLRLAIDAIDADAAGIVYLPVDHPMVRPDTVAALIAAARSAGSPLTLPSHKGKRGHPAVFGAALFAELTDPGLRGGARTVTHRHLDGALLLEVEDAGVLVDIDTPDMYEAVVGAGPAREESGA